MTKLQRLVLIPLFVTVTGGVAVLLVEWLLLPTLDSSSASLPRINESGLWVSVLGNNNSDPSDSWSRQVDLRRGDLLQAYVELHNEEPGTTLRDVRVRVSPPRIAGTTLSIEVAVVVAGFAGELTDHLSVNVPEGTRVRYLLGSARINADTDGDGVQDAAAVVALDDPKIQSEGILIGQLAGPDRFIAQVSVLLSAD
jgi:hypothetical protein